MTDKPRERRYTLGLLREALNLTQEEVAKRGNLTPKVVSDLEGLLGVEALESYARALGGELELRIVHGGRAYKLKLDNRLVSNEGGLEVASEAPPESPAGHPEATKSVGSAADAEDLAEGIAEHILEKIDGIRLFYDDMDIEAQAELREELVGRIAEMLPSSIK